MTSDAYARIGEILGELTLPTLIVQEGGYSLAAVAEAAPPSSRRDRAARNQAAGRKTVQQRRAQHATAPRLDDICADDLIVRIISALYQRVGAQRDDKALRRILFEEDDEIDAMDGAENGGARLFVLDRPARALEASGRGVAVQADDEPVAMARGVAQRRNMTGMEKIETAVGEADGQTLATPMIADRHRLFA